MSYSSYNYMFSFIINITLLDYHVCSAFNVRNCIGEFSKAIVILKYYLSILFDEIRPFIYSVGLSNV